MTHPSWSRAKQVFNEALEKSGPERLRFVDSACGEDAELRSQVLVLLAAHDRAGGFMVATGGGADAAARAIAGGASEEPIEEPGTRIGPYKLLQVIGEGGFGVVYMAEQVEPIHRRVALKIIKPGMDTREVIARFEAERQALAMMDHPNIAKVLDAGATDSGRPYFVMELVKGVPITEYCDANRLSTRERLELFVDVCKAVHHAHEKGIIHRDLKPSNVMVTLHDGVPIPKVIDFGIAKATNQPLTEKTLFTAYGQFLGTPTYMSPEQAALGGLEIDRRCDIYSLGVLLYELLTGTTPFELAALRSRAFAEMMRIIREEDPPTPSARLNTLGERLTQIATSRHVEPNALAKLLRGDLDWIVMRAIEKDRRRRYDSASELARDLGRYFQHEPVSARKPSAAYRLSKFAKRRRGRLVAAAGIAVAIMGGGILAPIVGLAPRASDEAKAPSTRLVVDLTKPRELSVPTRDGLHQLRYNLARRGYELVEIGSGKSKRLINAAPDPSHLEFLWPGRRLAPDGRLFAVGSQRDSAQSALVTLRLFSVGGAEEGRVIHRWEPDVSWVEVFDWSPRQTHVWVVVNREDKTVELATVAVGDGSVRVVKTLRWLSFGTGRASLSPDGRFLAYDHADERGEPRDIFLISTDGRREVRIEHPADDFNPLFAPDGSGIVFQSDRGGAAVWFQPVVDGHAAGEARPVWGELGLGGALMQFSANGSLFYHSGGNGWEIYTADVDVNRGLVGAPEHLAARGDEINNAPAFSPDGRFLAHLRGVGRRLVLRDLATGAEREFPISGALIGPTIDFCPDGQSLVVTGYESSAGRQGQVVYRVNLQLGGAERLPMTPEAFSAVACVGNGREIVYLAPRDRPDGVSQVVRQSLPDGKAKTLHDAARDGVLRSSDGSRLAFRARVNGKEQLLVMPSRGGRAMAVRPPSTADRVSWIMWLPGGNAMLAVTTPARQARGEASPEVTFWRIPLDGGMPTAAGRMRLPAYQNARFNARHYSLNPAGTRIAFERHAGVVNQVWAIDHMLGFIRSGASVPSRELRR